MLKIRNRLLDSGLRQRDEREKLLRNILLNFK